MNQKVFRVLMISVRADYGGGPEHIYRLVSNLPADIEVFIACPKEEPYWERFVKLVGVERIIEIPHRKFNAVSFYKLLQRVIINGISIIHSHGKGAGVYSRLLAIITTRKCVHTFHGIHVRDYNRLQRFMYLSLERIFSLFTSRLISVSKSEATEVLALKICRPEKLIIIENGVNILNETTNYQNANYSKLKVVSMSRFNYQKNSELLISICDNLKTYNRLDNFEINLLGTGPGESDFKKKVQNYRFEKVIKLLGPISNPVPILQNAFCYLSTSRWEGLPLSILEAMAVGLPVIATKVIGNVDIVKHGENGFLYDISNPEVAAQYLIKLADDNSKWLDFSSAGRKIVMCKYNVRRMAMETLYLYNSLRCKL